MGSESKIVKKLTVIIWVVVVVFVTVVVVVVAPCGTVVGVASAGFTLVFVVPVASGGTAVTTVFAGAGAAPCITKIKQTTSNFDYIQIIHNILLNLSIKINRRIKFYGLLFNNIL